MTNQTESGEAEARGPSNAPIPATEEGLRAQNRAYRTLIASMEQIQAHQTAKGREYHEAVTTLESERAANALLTVRIEELEAKNAARHQSSASVEGMVKALEYYANGIGFSEIEDGGEVARAALAAHRGEG